MVDNSARAVGLLAYDILDTPPERGYDDLVLLARQICATPIATMGLIDAHRQWFKAKTGTTVCESALEEAICRLVVEEDGPVEIEDLTCDPRTAANPNVLGGPKVRFYSGVPLRTPFGTIGALAVIDTVPRPGGLTTAQREALEKFSSLVVDLLELRRRSSALDDSQKRWRSLFSNMDEGYYLARVVRDETGRICDWLYQEVNPAWERHVGIGPDQVLGQTYGALFSVDEPEWVDLVTRTMESDRPVSFLQRLQSTGRWYDGTFYPVGQDYFSATFKEVTKQIAAEQRQAGLIALGDVLRDERDIALMISKAMEVIGTAFSADRATYGEIDHDIETITVSEGWALPEMPPIKGIYRFDDYGKLRPTLLAGDPLVITDTLTDIRTRDDSEAWLSLRARGVINVPVREDGRNVALMLVHFADPHEWTSEEIHWLHNAADRIELAIARRRADELQSMINGEIAHRLRNTLAMVQAVARMTLRHSLSKEEADRFHERLHSLGRAHDLLHSDDRRAAVLGDLVGNILGDASVLERCRISGPVIRLGTRAAMSTALLIHEMTTNACKHGALSLPEGIVTVEWLIEKTETGSDLVLLWQESHGPSVIPPTRKGFGARLISFGLIGTGGVSLRYEQEGLSASFRADIEKIMRT